MRTWATIVPVLWWALAATLIWPVLRAPFRTGRLGAWSAGGRLLAVTGMIAVTVVLWPMAPYSAFYLALTASCGGVLALGLGRVLRA